MAVVSTLSFLKLRLYAKLRLFKVKFHFGHQITFLKLGLYIKSRFAKSRIYCTYTVLWALRNTPRGDKQKLLSLSCSARLSCNYFLLLFSSLATNNVKVECVETF